MRMNTIGESVKSIVRQCLPPIFWSVIKDIVDPFHRRKLKPPQSSERQLALQKVFQRLNAGAQENELIFREHLNFVIHPDSRQGFEMFCYRSPEMVEEM